MICRTCRDKGLISGCPTCGKHMHTSGKGTVTLTPEILEENLIPEEYLDCDWNIDILNSNHPMLVNNMDYKNYCKSITKLVESFSAGLIPKSSGIIISDRSFGKKTLAYICMKIALSKGYTVCPMLDNTQIKRINELSSDNPNSYALKRLPSIDKIITSDVLFITVDYDRYSTALRTIESIMDKRARIGKSTFVISRYTLDEMSMFEKRDKYLTLIEPTGKFNNRKYPIIISFKQ